MQYSAILTENLKSDLRNKCESKFVKLSHCAYVCMSFITFTENSVKISEYVSTKFMENYDLTKNSLQHGNESPEFTIFCKK